MTTGSPRHETTALRAVGRHLVRHRLETLVAVLSSVIVVGSMFVLAPWAGTLLTDVLPAASPSRLAKHLAAGVALVLVLTGATFARDYLLTRSSVRFAADLRDAMVAHLLRQPLSALAVDASGAHLSRISHDIVLLQQALLRGLVTFAPNTVTVIALSLAIVATSPLMAGATALLALPMLWLVASFGRRLHGAVRGSQERLSELTAYAGESLDGARESKVFGREGALETRFRELSARTVTLALREERIVALHPAAVTFVAVFALAGLIFTSAWLHQRGAITGDALVRLLVLVGLVVGPLQEMSRASGAIGRFLALMGRCQELLTTSIEYDPPDAVMLPRTVAAISLERVRLDYPTTGFALGPLDVEFRADETIAIVGPSGAGKSTLLDLIPRLISPSSGTIRIGRHDIAQVTRSSLRSQLALLSQTPFLFRGTLFDNIRFSRPDAPESEVRRAAREAHVEEFALRLAHGYQTVLDSRGGNLSVGQRQRVALARAMLADPTILLLDEPTSALDVESEALLVAALRRFCVGRTTLIVTHRPALLAIADRVLLMERGGLEDDLPASEYLDRLTSDVSDTVDAGIASRS